MVLGIAGHIKAYGALMITRGHTNHRCGKSHHMARLTDAQVRAIRADHAAGKGGYPKLSKVYQCGESTIRDIVTMRTRWSA